MPATSPDSIASASSTFVPSFERCDARGRFTEILREGPWHTVVTGSMRCGAVLGNHFHKCTRVALYLMNGRATVDRVHLQSGERRTLNLRSGEGTYLEIGEAHAIRFQADSQFLMLKSVPYSEDDPDTYPWPVGEST